jgi:photosystem II stability/assembly factor-like uncharacterized protein
MKKFCLIFTVLILAFQNDYAQKSAAPNSVSAFYSYLTSVYFVSSNNGWAVGDKGVILNTIDGGTNWDLQSSGTANSLNSVVFIDKNNGFAVGRNGTILNTSNGGKTWVQQQSNTSNDLEDVFFTSKKNGIAVGFYKILKTTNGGINWTSISDDAVVWNSICFTDSNNGWIAGSAGAIWKTTDGGSNWNHLFENDQNSVEWFIDISFVDNNNGLAVDGFYGIHRTTDGGTTWNDSYNTGGGSNSFYNIFYMNVNTAFAVGDNGRILKTTDEGITWLSQTSGTNDALRSVYFTDLNNGIIVTSSGKILKTTNGGSDWIAQTNIIGAPILVSPVNDSLGIELSTILSWNDEIFNAASYQLQISVDSNFTSLFLNDSTIINQSEYYENKSLKISNLSAGTLYNWRVRDKINNVYGPWSNVQKFTTIGKTAYLEYPLNNSVLSPIDISLQWSNTTETTEYRVQVSTDSIFENIVLDKDNITNNSTAVNLNYNTKYFWRVGAKNIDEQTYWSNYRSFTTKPAPKTSFPLAIGNKWYYQAGSNQRGYYYGVKKEITDTLSNGFREVTSIYYYKDSLHISKEYWVYTDGKFYVNRSPSLNNASLYFDESITHDTCYESSGFTENCWSLYEYTIFNIKDTAQQYHTDSYVTHSGLISNLDIVMPNIGIVKTQSYYAPSLYYSTTDSIYLIGANINGKLLGDTTFFNFYRISIPISPGNNYTGLATTVKFEWQKAVDVESYRIQISIDTTFINSVFDFSGLTDTSKSIGQLKYNTKYYWRIETLSKDSHDYWSQPFNFTTVDSIWVGRPLFPSNNSTGLSTTVELKWNFIPDSKYELQLSRDSLFTSIIKDINNLVDTSYSFDSLNYNSKYFWRVKTNGYTSQVWNFTTISLPSKFELYQNYPNPFNPDTKIKYDLPKTELVTMRVYDILGREVTTLVNEEKAAGSYRVNFNAGNLASGVYLYRIQAGNYTSVKKMILIK